MWGARLAGYAPGVLCHDTRGLLEVAEVKSLAFEEKSSRKSAGSDEVVGDKMIRDALLLESSNIAQIKETQRALRFFAPVK